MAHTLSPTEQAAYQQWLVGLHSLSDALPSARQAGLRSMWARIDRMAHNRDARPLINGQPASDALVNLCWEELRARQPF